MDNCGWTPMLVSCQNAYLDLAKWLYEVGAAESIRTKTKGDISPLRIITQQRCSHVAPACEPTVLWLVLQGAANDEVSGHVDAWILERDTSVDIFRAALRKNISALLEQHSTFTFLVLPAACAAHSALADSLTRYALRSKNPRAPQASSPLALLCGHEETLLALIADFVGVVRGRQLRNAREAFIALTARAEIPEILSESDEEADY